MYRRQSNAGPMIGCLVVFLIIGLFCLAFSVWTEHNLEWCLLKLSGHPVDVPLWLAAALTFLTNMFGFLFNLICELLKLVYP